MSTLSDRFSALKSIHTSPKSKNQEPTPALVILRIYLKAEHECYINYMEGAKLLTDWLFPLAQIPSGHLPIPDAFRSYPMVELAKILAPSPEKISDTEAYLFYLYITYIYNKES